MEKLKPSTNYSFNENDLKFVVELAKVGHVHLLSNQVSLITTNDYSEGAAMDFKDSMNEEKCDGLRLPQNWCIEWIGSSKSKLHITFGIKKVLTIILISLFASCVPARAPYGCPKDVTKAVSLPANKYWFKCDSLSIGIDTSAWQRKWTVILTDSALRMGIVLGQTRYVVPGPEPKPKPKPDTIPERMHVSMRPKGFVLSMMALSVRDNGYCIAHLDCAGKPFPEHYKVGWCQGKDELLNRLVKGRAK